MYQHTPREKNTVNRKRKYYAILGYDEDRVRKIVTRKNVYSGWLGQKPRKPEIPVSMILREFN